MNDIKEKLAQRWSNRSPVEVANRFAGPLYGTAGEWDLPKDVTPKRDLLYLAVGIPDAKTLPKKKLETASQVVFSKPGDAALRYGFGAGPAQIREWLAQHRSTMEGVPVAADEFQMTNGSSGAIDLIVRSLINPGDVIIAENPTYMGTLHNFRGVGADVRFVNMDAEGIKVDELKRLLLELKDAGKNAKLLYTISTFQNPTGWTLSEQRRMAILELAHEHDLMILDDEAYRELWFDDEAPPPSFATLADNWGIVTTGTFSKTVATGIRVGWIHARPELLALFARMRFAMGQNQVGLRAMSEFLSAGEYEPHMEYVRDFYQAKRDALHAALTPAVGQYMQWQKPKGGFYFWARLNSDIPLEPLWRTAVEEGIAVNPGTGFSDASQTGPDCIRIAYAWTPQEHFLEAAKRLQTACERVLRGDAA
ncbi:MAG: PLP-dependent aminotransferase family protein [Pseudomonadales bacterium]